MNKNLQNFNKGIYQRKSCFCTVARALPNTWSNHQCYQRNGDGAGYCVCLVMSNLAVSSVKNFIPDKVRIPAFIVIIASFVTVVELVMQGFLPALFEQLGLFIPLIVVNCVVLGRAELSHPKHRFSSVIDGLGMGLGFTFALTILGGVRELLGSGAIFSLKLIEGDAMLVFVLAPGAFIALGYLIALTNKLNKN